MYLKEEEIWDGKHKTMWLNFKAALFECQLSIRNNELGYP